MESGFPDAGKALGKWKYSINDKKTRRIMTKFNEKSLHSFALAFYYSAM